MADAYGNITWWGFSPALDLQDKDLCTSLKDVNIKAPAKQDDLNILLVGTGDGRHLLKTIAQASRYPKRQINFYVLESSLELYARQMFFLGLALEPQSRMGLQEKTELFLELYGNTLVRQQSCDYVTKMATEFIKIVTDFDYLEKKLPVLDLSLLKYKERDMLEGIFKFWRSTDPALFESHKCWDLRLRSHLKERYDAIPNVFDWDYSMKLCERGASIVHSTEYKKWRHKGVAFEIREGTYDVSNKTIASGMVFKVDGERHARRGYWGDILISPYISYGIESVRKEFFKKANKSYIHTSQDVSEFNVLSMLYELVNKEVYTPPQSPEEKDSSETNKATLQEITEEEEEEFLKTNENPPVEHKETEDEKLQKEYTPLSLEDVKVHFLPLNSATEINKKSKYQKFFHTVYFSNSMVHHFKPELEPILADSASVILETAKFMLDLRSEHIQEFGKKIVGMAKAVGCKETVKCNPEQDAFARFSFSRSAS